MLSISGWPLRGDSDGGGGGGGGGGGRGLAVLTVVAVFFHLQENWAGVAGLNLAPVFWNLSNPIFKASKNDHIVVVNLFDEIDFVCPHYPPSAITDANVHEYYLIYRVTKKEYDDCNIYSENSTYLVLRCTNPRQKRRFTILFEPFQSIPNVPEYKAGHTYYFMTPSTGRKHGLRNLYQGACHQHNMKLTIKVRDADFDDENQDPKTANNNTLHHHWTEIVRDDYIDDDGNEQHPKGVIPARVPVGNRNDWAAAAAADGDGTYSTPSTSSMSDARRHKIHPQHIDRKGNHRPSHSTDRSADFAGEVYSEEEHRHLAPAENIPSSSLQSSRANIGRRRWELLRNVTVQFLLTILILKTAVERWRHEYSNLDLLSL